MKNRYTPFIIAVFAISILLFQFGCNKNNAIAVTGITLNKTSINIPVDSSQQLIAALTPGDASNQNVSWSSSNNAVTTVSASGLVTAVSAGTATITVTTQDGNKTAISNVTVNNEGSLTGSGLSSVTSVNLSTEGTADWAHWPDYDHKSSGGSKISNYVLVGSGTVFSYTNDPRTFSWSDGTPVATSISNKNGIFISGIDKGFQLTAPADLSSRTLKVHVGGWMSGGRFTAQLSDGSTANYADSSFSSATGQYTAVYILTYKAASAGKLLTVKWVQSSVTTGNVTLKAATLAE